VAAAVSVLDARIVSPTFCAGALTWVVRSDDAALVDEVGELYRGCRSTAASEAAVSFTIVRSNDACDVVDVFRDADLVQAGVPRALAIAYVVWAVNSEVVANAGARVLLHAAAVESSGAALVVSGAEGSGKSTLAAALVRAGLAYVTDEIVAIDETTGAVLPYAKPIVLEPGSWPLFEELGPPHVSGNDAGQWLVAPHRLGPVAAPAVSSVPRVLVFPSFEPEAACEAEPIARAAAVIALCGQSFNFRARSPGALEVVARVVGRCSCFTLRYGDARDAAQLARALLLERSTS
jgi:hypothetical protein